MLPLKTYEEMAAEEGIIDLGNDCCYIKGFDREGNWIAITYFHKNPDGDLCYGWVPFDVVSEYILPSTTKWEVCSLEPLHLEPSLECSCGHHGWIRDDRWVPC